MNAMFYLLTFINVIINTNIYALFFLFAAEVGFVVFSPEDTKDSSNRVRELSPGSNVKTADLQNEAYTQPSFTEEQPEIEDFTLELDTNIRTDSSMKTETEIPSKKSKLKYGSKKPIDGRFLKSTYHNRIHFTNATTARRLKRSNNYRQVYDYYTSYSPYLYNYNQQQFGARTARGTLRSNFPTSSNRRSGSSSNSNYGSSNSRGSPTYSNSDYDYVEYYDEPSPPPTTAAPARTAPASRLRGRIQPTPTSRRTPFTLTHSDNSANTNTRSTPTTRSRTSLQPYSRSSVTSRPSSSTNTRTFIPRRSQSRYQRPTEAPTTTSRSNRFRSRYNPRDSATTAAPTYTRSRFGTQLTRGRGTSSTSNSIGSRYNSNDNPPFEASTITVTHYIPQETTFPVVNGRSTEYKTVLTPSPSVEVLSPFQYTQTDYQGKLVLIKNDEVTSTVAPGVTEITQFLIRESTTSTVTFTPTTIRGRKTSFSHILPSTVYSVEPVVSTISNPLGPLLNQNPNDPNQLTNLLLNQLLGLNPNLLGLQGQQLLMANLLNPNNQLNPEPATPITQYSTITTSYTTTVTDFTSTVIPITLHGKAIKTTIVESSTKVISAVEYITSSTVITPSPPPQLLTQASQAPPQAALLQNLLQSQLLQQQLLQQQQLQPIVPTTPPQLLLPQVQPTQQVPLLQQLQQLQQQQLLPTQQPLIQQLQPQHKPQELNKDNVININNKNEQPETKNNDNEKKEQQKEQPKIEVTTAPPVVQPTKSDGVPPGSSVITVYVSGKKPGEFSTVLQTVPIDGSRKRRSITPQEQFTETIQPTQTLISAFHSSAVSKKEQEELSNTQLFSSDDVEQIGDFSNRLLRQEYIGVKNKDDLYNSNKYPLASPLEPSDSLTLEDNIVEINGNKKQRAYTMFSGESTDIILEDGYSHSDAFSNLLNIKSSSGTVGATESLDSVLGDVSHLYKQSASISLFPSS